MTAPSIANTTRPRPAGMGYVCDRWFSNPARCTNPDLPALARCQAPATVRLTLLTPTDCYQLKHCPDCAQWLRQEAKKGATFEILAETPL